MERDDTGIHRVLFNPEANQLQCSGLKTSHPESVKVSRPFGVVNRLSRRPFLTEWASVHAAVLSLRMLMVAPFLCWVKGWILNALSYESFFARSAALRPSKPESGMLGAAARGPAAQGEILFSALYGTISQFTRGFRTRARLFRPLGWIHLV